MEISLTRKHIASLADVKLSVYPIQKYARWWMAGILILSDLTGLSISWLVGLLVRRITLGNFELQRYLPFVPVFLGVALIFYTIRGLYPAIGLGPTEELRRMFVTTSIAYMSLIGLTFFFQLSQQYSRLILSVSWLLSLLLIPMLRSIVRALLARTGWWGEPLIVVGFGPCGAQVTRYLRQNPGLGLRPVLVIDGFGAENALPDDLPIIQLTDPVNQLLRITREGIHSALLISHEIPDELLAWIVDNKQVSFKRLILLSDLQRFGSLGVVALDLQGFVGLEVRKNLVNTLQKVIKRSLDLFIVFTIGLLALPLLGVISLLIALDSPGGVFYRQKRLGLRGKQFAMWKFRTMVKDAEHVLEEYLAHNPAARAEWDATQKLQDDPRVTRVGKWLRKFSLDELPQLYNILVGEMSVVGPRPFYDDQKEIYGDGYDLYTLVRPGVTGMWQVSGRNATTFAERAQWDAFYVRNWSIWLDLYIILKTVWVVLSSEGAY